MSLLLTACESTDLGEAVVVVAAFVFLGFFVWLLNR